jgi:hypothetical protein
LFGDFVPQVGNQFEILWAEESLFGAFEPTLISYPTLPGRRWNLEQRGRAVTLQVLSALLAGDYNQNGIVDAADYTVWRDHLGQMLTLPNEDPGQTPGWVTQEDYIVWMSHFGQTAGSGSGAATSANAGAAIPEPVSALLWVLGVTYMLVHRFTRPTSKEARWTIAGLAALLLLGLLHSREVHADTFGSEANTFSIGFVTVADPGNPDDSGTTGSWSSPYGGVDYTFRIGTSEISRDMISEANAEGNLAITMFSYAGAGISGGDRAGRPATGVTWNEAARFVNWLNVNSGHTPAHKFTLQPGDPGYSPDSNIELWQAGDAGYDPNNLYRNSSAFYFLPSEDEWYKAAYYSGSGSTYFDYATQQDFPAAPSGVSGGTASGTAVFQQNYFTGPADIDNAGGLSHYGTMAQNGNVWEWIESASDGSNNVSTDARTIRGAHWSHSVEYLRSNARITAAGPGWQDDEWGFRVAAPCLCPAIETQPQSQTVSVGSDVSFFVEVTGTEPLAYQWRKDDTPIPGAVDPSFSIFGVQLGDAGDYGVWSVNQCGAAMSDTASLTVILAGDYNKNGVVDAADYTVWRDTLGSMTDLRANGDNTGASAGVINSADYALWTANFGQHAGSGAAAIASASSDAAVPEPATLALLIAAIIAPASIAWRLQVGRPNH